MNLTKNEIKIIKLIQKDLPHSLTPYKEISKELNIPEEEIIETIKKLKNKKIIRRFGAILYHQRAGIKGNGMIVWNVPDEEVEKIGEKFSSFKEVTHCYERPRFKNWNYNLYTMVHGKDKKEIEEFAKKLSDISGIKDYRILFSIKEFKKSSMEYFLEEEDEQ